MTSNEIRTSFLKYFETKSHRIVSSYPLVPGDDPTLLFTNAGMNQFKDVFLGREKREYTRATTSQKCMRVSGKHNDLEEVGVTPRHHTFFEMLGNFSFGDYFKADAIRFAWELLTEGYGLPKDRLWATVHHSDDEAARLWREIAGLPASRVVRLGDKDNFWQMAETGPCGPCSEIHFDRRRDPGVDLTTEEFVAHTDRSEILEFWNLVFMQFDRAAGGALTPLPAPSIDTGMGLERLAAIIQQKPSNYDTDIFTPILERIGEVANIRYGASHEHDVSMRVVADHVRATVFLIGDGVMPSNEWRGYVLRKIMRRAMRHGKHLGTDQPFLHRLVAVLDREMGDAYPEIRTNREMIEKTVLAEENRFETVLTEGLPRLEAEIIKVARAKGNLLSGEAAFRLYDTFGVPMDFIEDTAATQGIAIDKEAFEAAMQAQRDKARAKSAFGAAKGTGAVGLTLELDGEDLTGMKDEFVGYENTRAATQIVALWDEHGSPVKALSEGRTGYAALVRTPFYIEAGGQVSDTGRIVSEASGAEATVEALVRIRPGAPRAHRLRMTSGALHVRDIVSAEVDADARNATRRNHTATHLLHAALRQVLGTHVKQAGSLVAPDRLRFDFVHFQPVTREELDRIERIVNGRVYENTPVQTEVRSTADAIAAGATALFGEKYGDNVRVVSVPGFSMELCGGTHVTATGDIGFFAIAGESGVAAGVRRIEAVTGGGAVGWAQRQRASLASILDALNVADTQAVETIERLHTDHKRLAREVTELKTKLAMGSSAASEDDVVEVAGVKLARRKVSGLDKDALRSLADSLKSRAKSGVVVLASENDGKVQIVVAVTPDLTARIKAGQVVKEIAPIVGGGGGGRPDFAEAGGKQPDKIDEMLEKSRAVVETMLRPPS